MDRIFDLVIAGGILLTMSDSMQVIHDPVIAVSDGVISLVEQKKDAPPSSLQAAEVIDASRCIIMPGLVNTHTHLAMTCFRGLADDLPLMDWLHQHIFPAESKHVNRDMVYQGSLLACAEMILSGTTTFCDGYFYESSVARAALDAGMRAVPGQGFIDLSVPDREEIREKVEVAENFVGKWSGVSPLIKPALFCHSPYTCSPETLREIKAVSRSTGAPFIIHLAETGDEVRLMKERYGASPVLHLERLGILDEGTIAVHCVWLDGADMDVLHSRGVAVSHCPESNMKLASGVAPIPELLNLGVVVGLGTDGCASNNDLDLFLEMDTAAKLHKVHRLDPTVMDARTVLRMATIEGARVLGLSDRVGSIEVGKWADIIILNLDKPHLTPLYNPFSHMVYAATGQDVTTSIIHGKIVMKDRRLVTLDLTRAMEEVRKISDRLRMRRTGDNL
jgi:5-methylthioadenosine/S-adenosylhomocysteine deaminase